jgi:hypothetical protein
MEFGRVRRDGDGDLGGIALMNYRYTEKVLDSSNQ